MSICITGDGDNYVAMYDSTTMWAFGPVFDDTEDAEAFINYAGRADGRDLRIIPDNEMEKLFGDFMAAPIYQCSECGHEAKGMRTELACPLCDAEGTWSEAVTLL
jgi:rubrerythrin